MKQCGFSPSERLGRGGSYGWIFFFYFFFLQLCCPLVENMKFLEHSLKQDYFISLLQSCNEIWNSWLSWFSISVANPFQNGCIYCMKLLGLPIGPNSAKQTAAVYPYVNSLWGEDLKWFRDFLVYFSEWTGICCEDASAKALLIGVSKMKSVEHEVLTLLQLVQGGVWTCCILQWFLSLGLSQCWRKFLVEPAPRLTAEVAYASVPWLLLVSRQGQLLLGWLLPSHVPKDDLALMWAQHLNHKNARTKAIVLIQSHGTDIWGPRHYCQCFSLNLFHTGPSQGIWVGQNSPFHILNLCFHPWSLGLFTFLLRFSPVLIGICFLLQNLLRNDSICCVICIGQVQSEFMETHLAQLIHLGVSKAFWVLYKLRFCKETSRLRNEAIVYLPLMARFRTATLHKLFSKGAGSPCTCKLWWLYIWGALTAQMELNWPLFKKAGKMYHCNINRKIPVKELKCSSPFWVWIGNMRNWSPV